MKVLHEYTAVKEQNKTGNFTEIQTRFGKITVNIDKQINFPGGLLGFEDFTQFCLADYPDDNQQNFKILQSIQNNELSLLVFPLADYSNFDQMYELKDLTEVAEKLGINPQNIVIIGVVSLNKTLEDAMELTINLRAPVIIDTQNFRGYQHVFINDKYEIRHKLND